MKKMYKLKDFLDIIEKYGISAYKPLNPIMTVRLINPIYWYQGFRMVEVKENKKSVTVILSLELGFNECCDTYEGDIHNPIYQSEKVIKDLKFILEQNPDIKVNFRYSHLEHYRKFMFNENKRQIYFKL